MASEAKIAPPGEWRSGRQTDSSLRLLDGACSIIEQFNTIMNVSFCQAILFNILKGFPEFRVNRQDGSGCEKIPGNKCVSIFACPSFWSRARAMPATMLKR